jgi:hypothetical protein
MMDNAEAMATNGVSDMSNLLTGWIPCDKKLPDTHRWVLAVIATTQEGTERDTVSMMRMSMKSDADYGTWEDCDVDSQNKYIDYFAGEVTHWMELPEPPNTPAS